MDSTFEVGRFVYGTSPGAKYQNILGWVSRCNVRVTVKYTDGNAVGWAKSNVKIATKEQIEHSNLPNHWRYRLWLDWKKGELLWVANKPKKQNTS